MSTLFSSSSSWYQFFCRHLPLSVLLPLLLWTVWRHKCQYCANLTQHGNWKFPLHHLRYSCLPHMYLFQIFHLFLWKRFDFINTCTEQISSINSKKPFQPFIFLLALWSISVYRNTSKFSIAECVISKIVEFYWFKFVNFSNTCTFITVLLFSVRLLFGV